METMRCVYVTPCGWCGKFDKKCDKKITDEDMMKFKILTVKDKDLEYIKNGKGLPPLHYDSYTSGIYHVEQDLN